MDRLKIGLPFLIVTFLVVSIIDSIDSTYSAKLISDSPQVYSLPLIASQIYGAAFNDASPNFDDIYIIKTLDKGRKIIIYCNATYCYKNRNSSMTA